MIAGPPATGRYLYQTDEPALTPRRDGDDGPLYALRRVPRAELEVLVERAEYMRLLDGVLICALRLKSGYTVTATYHVPWPLPPGAASTAHAAVHAMAMEELGRLEVYRRHHEANITPAAR